MADWQKLKADWIDPTWRHKLTTAVLTVIVGGLFTGGVVTWWRSTPPASTPAPPASPPPREPARIRVTDIAVQRGGNGQSGPLVAIAFDNAGGVDATGVADVRSFFLATRPPTPEDARAMQDAHLKSPAWPEAFKSSADRVLHKGDRPLNLTIPWRAGDRPDFERAFERTLAGNGYLWIFVTWRFRDELSNGEFRVKEFCLWLDKELAQHACGRS